MSVENKLYLIEFRDDIIPMSRCYTVWADDAYEAADKFKEQFPEFRIHQVAVIVSPGRKW